MSFCCMCVAKSNAPSLVALRTRPNAAFFVRVRIHTSQSISSSTTSDIRGTRTNYRTNVAVMCLLGRAGCVFFVCYSRRCLNDCLSIVIVSTVNTRVFEKGTMVAVHCVRDQGNDANQWLIWSDWLRFGIRLGLINIRLVHRVCQPFSRISGKHPSCRPSFAGSI